jgi:putative DNA primase/helicase
MRCDGPLRRPVPLTAIESARRAAVLKASQGPNEPLTAVVSAEIPDDAAVVDDAAAVERTDVREYGPHAARILSDCWREVALAPKESKRSVFEQAAKKMGHAVSGQLLPKTLVVDRLQVIADAHGSFGFSPDQIQQLIANAVEAIRIPETASPPVPQGRRLITHRASDLQIEKLEWVWPGRIPVGKLVLIGGPPGLGKSQLTTFISAVVSNGWAWPCGEGSAKVGDVIFMNAEDGIRDTILPRLVAAGAALHRVHIVASVTKPDGKGRKTFSLKNDVELLEAKAKEIAEVRLIIIDPISAYMSGTDANGNAEIREMMEPLSEMANRLHIAVLAVTHLNKGGGGGLSVLQRFSGSIGIIAAARAGFVVLQDPEDEERRLFLEVKSNLGPKSKGLAFRMEQRLVTGDIVSSNIFFESEHVSQSSDEALIASENRGAVAGQTSSKMEAIEFLREILANGPVEVLEVERQARAATLLDDDKRLRQNKPFRDARKDLGVLSTRDGFGPGARHYLSLPGTPCAPQKIMCAHSGEGAHMGNLGAYEGIDGFGVANVTTTV